MWKLLQAIYRFCAEHQIVSRDEYARLHQEVQNLLDKVNSQSNDLHDQCNRNWSFEQEIEKLTDQLEKAKAKPETVIDTLVKDAMEGMQ